MPSHGAMRAFARRGRRRRDRCHRTLERGHHALIARLVDEGRLLALELRARRRLQMRSRRLAGAERRRRGGRWLGLWRRSARHAVGHRRRGRRGAAHARVGAQCRRVEPAVEQGAELGHALRPVVRPRRQGRVDGVQQLGAVAGLRRVLAQAAQHLGHRFERRRCGQGRGRRQPPADAVAQQRRDAVQVGPRPLRRCVGRGADALGRREGRLEQRHQALRAAADEGPAHGAEIEQHRPVVGQQQDVVGRDRAMHQPGLVQAAEGTEQAVEQRAQRRLVGRVAHRLAQLEQGLAGVAGHRPVGRAPALPDAQHLHQRRMLAACELTRLLDEGGATALEDLGLRGRAQHHLPFVVVQHQRRRQVFLDRHRPAEGPVERPIDDREAARGEHALDLEIAVQPRARR